jgi:hypothetical protein
LGSAATYHEDDSERERGYLHGVVLLSASAAKYETELDYLTTRKRGSGSGGSKMMLEVRQ